MVAGPLGDGTILRPQAMRQRIIVGTKLLETIGRGIFVLFCTYRLPVVDAGQFGLAVTLIGMVAFLLGYERQIDVQRDVAGRPFAAIRQRMSDTLRFFATQYAWLLPLTAIVYWLAFGWSAGTIGLVILISVAEHLSNQSYQAVLLSGRNFPLQALAAAKTVVLLLTVLGLALAGPQPFTVDLVLLMWALVSLLFVVLATWIWMVGLRISPEEVILNGPHQGVLEQYRASRLHFMVGVVAVTALQADRLVVGGMLSAHDIGVFFRNIMVTALALQLFNIVSFNRVAPTVYALVRDGRANEGRRVVRSAYRLFAMATLVLFTIALAINLLTGDPVAQFGVDFGFLAVLTLGVLLRGAADYAGLLLLSNGKDASVFFNQTVAVAIGVTALFAMVWQFGLPGAIAGTLSTSLIYLAMNYLAVRHRS